MFFKIDNCGEVEWCTILTSADYNVAEDVVSLQNGDGYIGMMRYYGEGSEYSRISLVKLDQSGEPVWIQRLAQEDSLIQNEEGGFLNLTSDSNYLVSGQCFHPGLKPLWIKTDTTGNQLWDLMWQGGIGVAYQSDESPDNILYCVGSFAESGMPITPTLYKFDNSGNPLDKYYILNDTIDGGEAVSIKVNTDSTILTGLIWGIDSLGLIVYRSEIIKLDTLGNILKRNILLNETKAPKVIINTFDKKILVAGNYVVDGNWDIYLWKLNQDLIFDSLYTQPMTYDSLCPYPITSDTIDLDCGVFVNIDEIPTKAEYESSIRISPNPARGWISLGLPDNVASGQVELSIFNTFGQRVLEKTVIPSNQQISLNISSLKPGLYIAVCIDKKKQVMRGKFVKVTG